MMVESRAKLSGLHTSPRKVRLLADLVRGKSVADAKLQLNASKKHAARPMLKLIDSAVANAVHNHMAKPETLKIATVFVNEGATMKRWIPKAMGRATRINKRTSHITLVLSGEAQEAAVRPTPKKKTAEDAVETTETPDAEDTKTTKKPAAKKTATKKAAPKKKAPAKKTTKKTDSKKSA